jgi:hypothetical protein
MGEAAKVIMVTPDELEQLVRKAVREELAGAPLPAPEKAYNTQEAAEYLRMSPNALSHHIRAGNITPDVFGGRGRTRAHRFRKDTLDAFLGDSRGR